MARHAIHPPASCTKIMPKMSQRYPVQARITMLEATARTLPVTMSFLVRLS